MIVSSAGLSLPPQMIPESKKNEQWKKDNMDAMEAFGRQQFYLNSRLIENYEMVRGRFIYSHYLDREDYSDIVTQLSREFEIPSHLRHYDIISQVINTLSGEWQKRPDIFRVKDMSESSTNEYVKQKSEMMLEYVMQEINKGINQKLADKGIDVNNPDPQAQQEIQQQREAMTPPEVERYMKTSWSGAAEIWAEHQLEFDKQRFNLSEKEKIEFEDMLVADRCFRHFYLTANDYCQETWNPINTFYHKSPEILYIEDGDYVGRVFYLSVSEIINRYGHKMTSDQIETLEKYKKDSYDKNQGFGEQSYGGVQPGTVVPSWNYPEQHFVTSTLGYNPNTPETADNDIMVALGGQSAIGDLNRYVFYQVTEGYWMGQMRIGKLVTLDPETGEKIIQIVNETFDPKLFPEIKVTDDAFMEMGNDEEINTLTWTWVNQSYKGIKVNNRWNDLAEPIYIDVKPNEFQFKGNVNVYGAKLPVCGQVFNNRNAESMALVDLMKPHQIGHNVAMNQLYEIMQREIGRFMLFDMNFAPSGKDWGGERNYEKVMLVARQLGIAPVDSSPANTKGSNFAHFQEIDLDESARMLSRLKIAEAFEQLALKQVGITPQRLGSTTASESATGVQQAVNQSYAQTESYFTNFSNYKKRCLQMNLDIAQFVQSREETVSFMYTSSDLSRAFIKINGDDLLLSDFGVFVVNSNEATRQIETLRQLFMESNTTGATPVDLATVITSNSPSEIKAQLEASYERAQQLEQQKVQQQQQLQQQQLQVQQQIAKEQQAFDADQAELDRANDRYIAEIKSLGYAKDTDLNQDGVPDALEVQKFNAQIGQHSEDILFQKQKEANAAKHANKKLQLEQERIALDKKTLDNQKEENEKDRQLEREKIKAQKKQKKSS